VHWESSCEPASTCLVEGLRSIGDLYSSCPPAYAGALSTFSFVRS